MLIGPWGELPVEEALLRFVVSCVLCGLIGLEREYRQKSAGLRTHLLVGLGSTMFTLLSVHGFGTSDPGRVAAQIVTGIGFIGGGAILRHGLSVKGLTTASAMWLVASIGMAVGVGWFVPAFLATAIALIALIVLSWVEAWLPTWQPPAQLRVRLSLPQSEMEGLRQLLEEECWAIREGAFERLSGGRIRVRYLLKRSSGTDLELRHLLSKLEAMEHIEELSWERSEPIS